MGEICLLCEEKCLKVSGSNSIHSIFLYFPKQNRFFFKPRGENGFLYLDEKQGTEYTKHK